MPATRKLGEIGIGCTAGSISVTATRVSLDQAGAYVLAQSARNTEGHRFAECRGCRLRLP